MTDQRLPSEENKDTSSMRRSFLKGMVSIPALGAVSSLLMSGSANATDKVAKGESGKVYNIAGNYFESCSCTTAVCPCLFLNDPTEGYCKAFPSWHIEKGHLGDVKLDRLNVAAWLHSPGNLTHGNWRLALYIDENASDKQFAAIEELWTGKHGGHLAVIASLVSEYMGSQRAKISWKEEGKTRTMMVDGVGGVETVAYEGADGADVTLHDTPLAIAPPHPITISKSTRWDYKDKGVDVLLSDTAGLASAFSYSA